MACSCLLCWFASELLGPVPRISDHAIEMMRKDTRFAGTVGIGAIVVGVLGAVLGFVLIVGGYWRSGVWSGGLGVVCVISGVSVRTLARRRG